MKRIPKDLREWILWRLFTYPKTRPIKLNSATMQDFITDSNYDIDSKPKDVQETVSQLLDEGLIFKANNNTDYILTEYKEYYDKVKTVNNKHLEVDVVNKEKAKEIELDNKAKQPESTPEKIKTKPKQSNLEELFYLLDD